MKLRLLAKAALAVALSAAALPAGATKLIGLKVVDKDYLMVHFRDGEVRYRDDGTGPSAYLGHTFVEGDDTLKVFGQRLDASVAAQAQGWKITSSDDKAFGSLSCEVVNLEMLKPNQNDVLMEKQHENDWDITLFTCNFSGTERITVRCKMKEIK